MNPALCYKDRPCGAVAQLGERLNGIQEVVGSIPIGSTIFLSQLAAKGKCHGVVRKDEAGSRATCPQADDTRTM